LSTDDDEGGFTLLSVGSSFFAICDDDLLRLENFLMETKKKNKNTRNKKEQNSQRTVVWRLQLSPSLPNCPCTQTTKEKKKKSPPAVFGEKPKFGPLGLKRLTKSFHTHHFFTNQPL
jgi:hypothetical protein